ncbi:receptor-like protein 56 [Abrus precatorius]|uniref:Receptor-like protein 56 n=1 Tax=Abrus precatorius TaxID=3816 RepID=A0A8B8KM29_ABRPR|nr:receptor-like protein 56 [Abrus precatorius]
MFNLLSKLELPWKKRWLVWFGFGTIIVWCQALGTSGCLEEEKDALLKFKGAYSNDSYLGSWVNEAKSNCCAWDGVTCDSSSGHVVALSLEAVHRNGDPGWQKRCTNSTRLSWSLFLSFKELRSLDLTNDCFDAFVANPDYNGKSTLQKLETLNLSYNFLNESIMELLSPLPSLKTLILSDNDMGEPFLPTALSLLQNLEQLDMSNNNLRSSFWPQALANLSMLKVLKLSNSSLSGAFPNEGLCKMKQLQELDLSRNHFRGTLGTCLGNLTSLQRLDLSDNLLIGSIPISLSNQTGLTNFDLSGNNLVGTFPSWLFVNNPKLEVVSLNDNSFTGTFELPFDLNHHMDQLYELDLSNNQIQGELPNNIGYLLPRLEYFDVSNNMFHGRVPASIGEMSGLTNLFLRDNKFSGEIPDHIIKGCMSLNYLMMDNNQLNGTLPSGIGKLGLATLTAASNNLEGAITKEFCQLDLDILDLRHNKFSGALPSCFKMPSYYLFLQGNSLSGMITEAFINSSGMDLAGMDLSDNKFIGTIPQSIYELKSLRFLLLAGNQLQGQLCSQICKLQNVDILDLSRNNFTGSIPSCLNNMSFGEKYFSSHYEPGFRLTPFKAIPEFTEVQLITKGFSHSYEGATLEYMSGLDLSSNQLIGEIPHQIGNLYALHALNLSHNHLNGPIPQSFQKLQSIESFDLSNNNLSGQIPLQLQDLHSLSVFNVSYNNLSGRAPDKGQFGTFDESSYKGNPYLTWNNSNRGSTILQSPPTLLNGGEQNKSTIDFTSFVWSFAASYVMALLVLVAILWINPHWRTVWFSSVEGCLHKCFGHFLNDSFH